MLMAFFYGFGCGQLVMLGIVVYQRHRERTHGVEATCCGKTMPLGIRCEGCPHAKLGDKLVPRRTDDAASIVPEWEGVDGVGGRDAPTA